MLKAWRKIVLSAGVKVALHIVLHIYEFNCVLCHNYVHYILTEVPSTDDILSVCLSVRSLGTQTRTIREGNVRCRPILHESCSQGI